jgi:hypothetical protein
MDTSLVVTLLCHGKAIMVTKKTPQHLSSPSAILMPSLPQNSLLDTQKHMRSAALLMGLPLVEVTLVFIPTRILQAPIFPAATSTQQANNSLSLVLPSSSQQILKCILLCQCKPKIYFTICFTSSCRCRLLLRMGETLGER